MSDKMAVDKETIKAVENAIVQEAEAIVEGTKEFQQSTEEAATTSRLKCLVDLNTIMENTVMVAKNLNQLAVDGVAATRKYEVGFDSIAEDETQLGGLE